MLIVRKSASLQLKVVKIRQIYKSAPKIKRSLPKQLTTV
jgi:hypothetical protein